MGSDTDGREKLKRARKLLGNADINKSDSEGETEDPASTVPISKELRAPVTDRPQPPPEATETPPVPAAPPKPAPTVSSPSDESRPALEPVPAKPTPLPRVPKNAMPPENPAAVKAFIHRPKPQRDGIEMSAVTEAPPETLPETGATGQPDFQPKVTAPTSVVPVVTETKNHQLHSGKDELIESLPKTAWGVKVAMKDFVFIRDHDKYCVLLKDSRTFREKFVEWMRNLETCVAPELAAARDVTLNARKAIPGPAPEPPDGDSGDHL